MRESLTMTVKRKQAIFPSCSRILTIIILGAMVLSGVTPVAVSGEELDSDHDGWSDEYERTIGTDPFNPDTDGDGIEDPDDPTPKGSLINEEEIWETFEVEVEPSQNFSTVDEDIQISVRVEKNDIPIVGRRVWLFIYFNDDGYEKINEESRILSDGSTSFSFRPDRSGDYVFLAIVNRSAVSPGYEISISEMSQIRQRKQGGYTYFEVFPTYETGISSHYRNILAGQKGTFFIQKWKYSKDLAEEFSGHYPGLSDIYEPISGKVYVSIGDVESDKEIGSYKIYVGKDGSNWSHKFTKEGYYRIAVSPHSINSCWIEDPWKFSYPYTSISVKDTMVTWLETPKDARVLEEHSIKVHRVYLDPGMGPELFNQLYSRHSLETIAEMYPQYTTPWNGNAYVSLLYQKYPYSLLVKQETVQVNGEGEISYFFNTPGSYMATLSFTGMPAYPRDRRFELYDHYHDYYKLADYHAYFHVKTDLVTSVFSNREVFFTGEDCGITISTMEDSNPVNSVPIALYLDDEYLTTLEPSESGVTEYSLEGISHGDRTISVLPVFTENTKRIADIMGMDRMASESWVGNTDVHVRNLAIYTHLPYRFVMEQEAPLHILVYGGGFLPLENANVNVEFLYRNYNGIVRTKEVAYGTTDASGAFSPVITVPGSGSGYYNRISIDVDNEGISERVEYRIIIRDDTINCQFTLNKPIYRGGDTVHTSFLIWNADSVSPVSADILVRLVDPYDRTIIKTETSTDSYGHGSADFSLPGKLPWGEYTIRIGFDGHTFYKTFEVKDYDLPETRISFDHAPTEAIPGGNVTVPLRVEYMFGAPVTEGTVEFTVNEYNPYRYYYRYWDYYYENLFYKSDLVFLNDGPKGEGGNGEGGFPFHDTVEVKNGWANLTFIVPENAVNMKITADFSDRFGHSNVGSHILSTCFTTVGAELSVILNSTTYLPDVEIPCVITSTEDGEPIPEVDLNITIIASDPQDTKQDFSFEIRTDESGEYGFDVRDKVPYEELLRDDFLWFGVTARLTDDPSLVSNEGGFIVHRIMGRITTDRTDYSAGEDVEIAFGEYDLVDREWTETNYTLQVSYQRPITTEYRVSSTSIPVLISSGVIENEERIIFSIPDHMPTGTYLITATFDNTVVEHKIQVYMKDERIILSTDVKSYIAGEDIHIHISTVNTAGKWLYVDVVTGRSLFTYSVFMDGSDIHMTLPTADYRHSVDVRAYFISDHGGIVVDYLSLRQDLSGFNINLTNDKDTYEPGETAYLNLTITDEHGDPIPDLLVGLSIVDSAVFELEEDSDEDTLFSGYYAPYEQERYYRLRANFVYVSWSPEELVNHTESYWPEFEEITVGNGSPEYDEDGYSRINTGGVEFNTPKTATLGGDLSQALEETEVRSDFRETAYWVAGLEVVNGTYSWEIILPDNLARWRVKLLAITDCCFGAVKTIYFNTSKDFFVDVEIPHRVTQDDEFTLVTRIHNFNDEALDISMGLTAGPWLKVFGANEFDISMKENSVREVEFNVKVLENGLHNLTLIATDFESHTDAIRKDMFVRPNGALKTIHLTGSVEDSETEEIEFLPELVEGSELVVLRLAVGYEGLLEEGARMLWGYPYDCTEQIMSALLPNVLLYEHYTLSGEMSWQIRKEYERNIYHGILKLLSNQHYDGGWGWWKNDETDGFMTAYVLFGLSRTKDAGFHVSDRVLKDAQDVLVERMNDEGIWAPAHWMGENHIVMTLYVSYALAVSGFDASGLGHSLNSLARAWNKGEIDDPYELSLYALLLQELGRDNSDVVGSLVESLTGSHWQAGSSLGGGDETTAWAAYVLTRSGGHKAVVRGALEWLADQRLPSGGWGTTSDTIAALILINEVIKTSERPNMDVTVNVNGETLITRHVDHTYASQHEFRSALDALKLNNYMNKDKKNTITIQRTGTGDLFYELTTIQYLRKGIEVEYAENITAPEDETFEVEVKVRPEASENVNIAGLDVLLPETDSLVLISSESNGSDEEERTFTYSYLGTVAGKYSLGPIVVSYSLESGERPSATIREYFQGFNVTITSSGSGTRSENPRYPTEGSSKGKISLVKIISGSPVVIGEPVDVRIIASIPEELVNEKIRIADTIPQGFKAAGELEGIESGDIVVTSKGESVVAFNYTLIPGREYSGKLPRVLLYNADELLEYSNSPALRVIRGDDIAIERIYSTHSTEQNNPVFVGLYLRAPEGLIYAAVEDILPPGCRVLEDSVKANLDENVLSYTITGEKVVFFISEVEEVSLQYQFIPTIVGEFAVPSAEMYSMYETEKRAESAPDYLSVGEPVEKGIKTETDHTDLTITLSQEGVPDNLTAGVATEFVVTIYSLGSQNVQGVPLGLYMDGKVIWRDSINLPFCSSTIVRIPWIPEEGEHTIRIVVDDLNMVEETDEDNNAMEFTVGVSKGKSEGKNEISTLLPLMVLTLAATATLTIYIGIRTGRGSAMMTGRGWRMAGKGWEMTGRSLKKRVRKGKGR